MTATPRHRSDWVEGERVFGPPTGTFDADWVAGAACALEPRLTHADAHVLAVTAWQAWRAGAAPDALAGVLPGPFGGVVARVVREYCALYAVDPG